MDELGLMSEAYADDSIKKLEGAENPLERVHRSHFFLKRFFYVYSCFLRENIEGFIDCLSFLMNPVVEKLEEDGYFM